MHLKEQFINFLARRLPTCKEVTRMASDSMEQKLPLRQRINMKLHFMICVWCLRYFKQLQFMREAIHQRDAHATGEKSSSTSSLSSEARERMKRTLSGNE